MKLFRRAKTTSPTMTLEGVLGQNNRLDEAQARPAAGARAIAVAADGALLVAQDRALVRIKDWQAEGQIVHRVADRILALCLSAQGAIALVCEGGALHVLAPDFTPDRSWPQTSGIAAASDALFTSESEMLILDGGIGSGEDSLARATWDDSAKGAVVRLAQDGTRHVLAGDLHAPAGLCMGPDGPLITQMERACISDASGRVMRGGLPGYLGRLRPVAGGYLLACLARRDPLIEFLKTEHAFVAEMKRTIAPAHWISPRIDPAFSHDFPIEMGATRLFGQVKAWAPSFSYGLLIELDDQLRPTGSAHSRANGARHGICDALVWQGATIALCLGTGELLRLETEE